MIHIRPVLGSSISCLLGCSITVTVLCPFISVSQDATLVVELWTNCPDRATKGCVCWHAVRCRRKCRRHGCFKPLNINNSIDINESRRNECGECEYGGTLFPLKTGAFEYTARLSYPCLFCAPKTRPKSTLHYCKLRKQSPITWAGTYERNSSINVVAAPLGLNIYHIH
jgi:hypothetical protein